MKKYAVFILLFFLMSSTALAFSITGGTTTTFSNATGTYEVHTFTANDSMNVSGTQQILYLVVAGGGGGGGSLDGNGAAAGGGAGGLRYGNMSISTGTYAVTVGNGGFGGLQDTPTNGGNGTFSNFSIIKANGGGGGSMASGGGKAGHAGGSSGGSYYTTAPAAGNIGGYSPPEGTSGGTGCNGNAYNGGSGGGSSTNGSTNSCAAVTGKWAGNGTALNISGNNSYYAGGGGGGQSNFVAPQAGSVITGGLGGGGNGANDTVAATAGSANTGGGGGGGSGLDPYQNGAAGGSGVVIVTYLLASVTTPPSWVAPTPVDGAINNTQVILNASCGLNLTTIWFDTNPTPTTIVVNNRTTGNYTTSVSSTATYYYIAACYNGSSGMSSNTTVRNFTYDAVFPTITINPTNEFNMQNYSRRSPYDKLVHLNFTIADDNDVYGFSVNITRGGTVFFNYSNETLSGRRQYNYTATVNSASWLVGTYNVTVMASDTHTKSAIGDYNVAKSNRKLEFYTDKGINVVVESNEDAVTDSMKKGDRYDFTYDFTDSSKKKRWFDLTASAPITYLPNSPYQGHFIIGGEHWLDFEGQGLVSEVKSLGNNRYRIIFDNLNSDVTFNSIGGLNIYQANFTFYQGNYSYNNPLVLATDPTTLWSNFTIDSTIKNISSTFLYNGSLQTVSSSNTTSLFTFISNVIAPNATFLQLFNWSVTVTQQDGNTSTFNITDYQNVTLFTVTACGVNPIINLTMYDENTPANKLSSVPQVLFTYYSQNSSLSRTYNNTFANNSVFSLCISPSYATVQGTLYVQYLADLSQYTHRYYVFNGTYTNTTTQYSLYNWNNTGASLLKIITRFNSNYNFYPNVLTHLERRYVGENVWRVVQMDSSGDYGLVSFHIRELDTDYRLTYYDTDYNILKITDSLKFSCTSFLCELTQTLTPFSGSSTGDNFSSNVTYNNVTKIITLTWSDPDLATNSVNFSVTSGINKNSICNIIQSGSSGVATCNASNYTGSVYASTSFNGELHDGRWINILTGSLGTLLGTREASFISGGIIITVMMTAIFSPVAAMIAAVFGVFVVFQFGILPWVTTTFMIIMTVITIVIAYKVKT